MAIPPTTDNPSNLGLIGMDPAGFPNGRRVFDDVATIELRALAGATYALVDKSYTPDKAAGAVTYGITSSNTDVTAGNTVHYLPTFPYLGTPHGGFYNPDVNAPAPDLGDMPIPVGGVATGGGSTAGVQDKGVLIAGGAALVGAAVAGTIAATRPRHAAPSDEPAPQPS